MVSVDLLSLGSAADLTIQGVGGGAWYPSAQGSVADRISTRRSYLVPMSGYMAMLIYSVYVIFSFMKHLLFHISCLSASHERGIVVDQTMKGGFRFRNVHEEERVHVKAGKRAALEDVEVVESIHTGKDADSVSIHKEKDEMIEQI